MRPFLDVKFYRGEGREARGKSVRRGQTRRGRQRGPRARGQGDFMLVLPGGGRLWARSGKSDGPRCPGVLMTDFANALISLLFRCNLRKQIARLDTLRKYVCPYPINHLCGAVWLYTLHCVVYLFFNGPFQPVIGGLLSG